MADDIVERLRNHSKRFAGCDCVRCEAASLLTQLEAEIERLRQGIWDACIALGMDTDGNDTPRHVVYPPLAELIVREAQRVMRDYDELLDELGEARRG